MKDFDITCAPDEEISGCSEYDSELGICKTTKKSCDGCYINPVSQD